MQSLLIMCLQRQLYKIPYRLLSVARLKPFWLCFTEAASQKSGSLLQEVLPQ